ncbi:MAG: Uncharacterized protein G01um101417_643 [Parcubacteria group bacterium Gr01-1014_17]|nr:MAG: Uncharacterized protein G01um101417_643 [Parcubacteria group bacterium Gr01-1014_17]
MKKLLIITILLGIALAPVGAGVAFAEGEGGVIGKVMGFFSFGDQITFFIAEVGNAVLTLVSKVLDIAGAVLNFSVEKTINMSEFLAQVKIVDVGWKVFRDIANLFFIFVLLWIGIRTILGLGGGEIKKLLLNVVIMALLINFSLFITKAIVDAGNIATIHFYDAMRPDLYENIKQPNGTYVRQPARDAQGKQLKAGLSDIYMEALKLQTFMGEGSSASDNIASAGGFANQFRKIFVATTLGSVFFLVAAFIFFAAAVLFIIRAVVLMIVMLLSPLAFVAWILPNSQAQKLNSDWWHALFSQTFFAPLYMALTYVVAKAIQSGGFGQLLNITGNQASFAALLTAPAYENVGIVVNYIILIILMGATLLIANSMAGKGGQMVMGWGQKLKGWGMGKVKGAAYGATIGAAGGMLSRIAGAHGKSVEEKYRGSTSTFGRAAMRYAERLQSAKVGGTTNAKERQEKGTFFGVGEKEAEENLKEMRGKPEEQARYLSQLKGETQQKIYEKLSARDRAAVEKEGLDSKVLTSEILKTLKDKLSVEEREKTEKALKESRKEETKDVREKTISDIAKAIQEAVRRGITDPLAAGVTVNAGTPKERTYSRTDVEDEIKKASEKEIVGWDAETLKTIGTLLSSGQFKAIMDDKELSSEQKKGVKEEHYRDLIIAAGGGVMGVPTDPARMDSMYVQTLMSKYNADEVARFSDELKVLPEIMRNYTQNHLVAMAKQGLSDETASTIRNAIIKTGTAKNIIGWLRTSPAAQDVFGTDEPRKRETMSGIV